MDEMTDDEALRVTNAYIATANALGDLLAALARLDAVTFDPNDKLKIANARRRLEDETAENERRYQAFWAGDIGLHPPGQDLVDSIVRNASEVALLSAQNAQLNAVLALADKTIALFKPVLEG